MITRSFPWAYRDDPGGGGPVQITPGAGGIPAGASPTPSINQRPVIGSGAMTPMGSAIYLPPIKAMADRTLPPEYWTMGNTS